MNSDLGLPLESFDPQRFLISGPPILEMIAPNQTNINRFKYTVASLMLTCFAPQHAKTIYRPVAVINGISRLIHLPELRRLSPILAFIENVVQSVHEATVNSLIGFACVLPISRNHKFARMSLSLIVSTALNEYIESFKAHDIIAVTTSRIVGHATTLYIIGCAFRQGFYRSYRQMPDVFRV